MMLTIETGMQQVEALLHSYNGIHIEEVSDDRISLKGTITVNREALNFHLYKDYDIQIVIPIEKEELPYVIDVGNQIDVHYPHRYVDGRLCLETDTHIEMRFLDGFSLISWVDEYVEPYFFSYEYYQKYEEFPFGERSHGWMGVVETYSEIFNEKDIYKTVLLMKAIFMGNYRGHVLCPCSSGLKYRKCHGILTKRFYIDDRLKNIVMQDYELLLKEVKLQSE